MKNLVIVESPAKAKTLEKFLGKEFTVKSSYGHIRDLVKKDLGIDVDNNFEPTYEITPDKKKVATELTKAAKEAETVWLATDEDREGEAIAWHLSEVLGLPVEGTKRIAFHEITKSAILEAIENPRTINMDLVDAQQARRILDRLVGFQLSPLLWRKIRPSLSAGRVQSVTVRLLVEREREIIDFVPKEYYRVSAIFFSLEDPKKIEFKASISKRFGNKSDAEALLRQCLNAEFNITSCESKPAKRSPAAPFTTSTLQQEAGRKLGMSVLQTMAVAQKLYENGWITYMRTDSVNLSGQAIAAAKQEIEKQFGQEYSHPRNYTTKTKGAQEAHEAIRPSYFDRMTVDGTQTEKRLYDLIWKRAVASQMAPAEFERTTANIGISGSKEYFTATGEVIKFEGFLKLYIESTDDDDSAQSDSSDTTLPVMKVGDKVLPVEIVATQRFTQSPARYSEAALVKQLEELGIGRPSTYAPTIATIIARGYAVKQSREGAERKYVELRLTEGAVKEQIGRENVGSERNRLSPTDIAMVVNDYLEDQFSEIMDYHFTAKVEKEFDEIAEGNKEWINMIRDFYTPFNSAVEKAMETTRPEEINRGRVLGRDPETGREVTARVARYGPVVQLEPENEEDKPKYASLRKDQLIESITLEDALELFKLPRTLVELGGEEIVVGIGKFGPYLRHDGKFTSIPKSEDPYTITLKRAVELIAEKKLQDAEAKTPIVTFDQEPEMEVLRGRYGPYIAYKSKNYPIPRSIDPEILTLEQAREIIAKRDARGESKGRGRAKSTAKPKAKPATKPKAKPATKTKAKPVTKKAAPKKSAKTDK